MKFLINTIKSFTKFEFWLWMCSTVGIVASFFFAGNDEYMTLAASLTGASALIFVAKGNVIGQILTVIFSIMYGYISFKCRYFGEMITYLGMTAPIAAASIVTWLRNSYKGNKAEVKINSLSKKEYVFMCSVGLLVTFVFYYILKYFNTNNLILSTVSVFTSFLAAYLTMRRSELYALAYAINDVVLIALWVLVTLNKLNYLPMVICFVVFLINDLYGFLNWSKTKKHQADDKTNH